MAKVIDFAFAKKWRYPWHIYLDGRTWQLEQGVDFECEPGVMYIQCSNAARRRGCHIRGMVIGTKVIVKAER